VTAAYPELKIVTNSWLFAYILEAPMANSSDQDKRLEFPAWEREYQAAVGETNPLRLGEKIHAAETAIAKRLRDIENALGNSAERQAIEEAMTTLQKIQIKTFGHSDWQT
jgi:hypothetical protein